MSPKDTKGTKGKLAGSNSRALKYRGAEISPNFKLSQHLERCNGTQVLDLDTHQKIRRFVMRYALPRQIADKSAPSGFFY
jgi:hypothetical protein